MNPLARCALRVGMAVVAAATIIAPAPAAASSSNGPFMVVNSASFQAGPVPRGSLLSIITAGALSFEPAAVFNPWERQTPGGTYVEATCGPDGAPMRLPIRSIGPSLQGSRIDVYFPNSMGREPWGSCADSGRGHIWLYTNGLSDPLAVEVESVRAHPGIFAVGGEPDGDHVDGHTGAATSILSCNARLPADPVACPVRTLGKPAALRLSLTGSEFFACDPCTGTQLIFELARVVDGVPGAYVPQTLASLIPESTGLERVTIILRADTAAGQYLLRVRNTLRPEFPPPLRVELGKPIDAPQP